MMTELYWKKGQTKIDISAMNVFERKALYDLHSNPRTRQTLLCSSCDKGRYSLRCVDNEIIPYYYPKWGEHDPECDNHPIYEAMDNMYSYLKTVKTSNVFPEIIVDLHGLFSSQEYENDGVETPSDLDGNETKYPVGKYKTENTITTHKSIKKFSSFESISAFIINNSNLFFTGTTSVSIFNNIRIKMQKVINLTDIVIDPNEFEKLNPEGIINTPLLVCCTIRKTKKIGSYSIGHSKWFLHLPAEFCNIDSANIIAITKYQYQYNGCYNFALYRPEYFSVANTYPCSNKLFFFDPISAEIADCLIKNNIKFKLPSLICRKDTEEATSYRQTFKYGKGYVYPQFIVVYNGKRFIVEGVHIPGDRTNIQNYKIDYALRKELLSTVPGYHYIEIGTKENIDNFIIDALSAY
jgi:hypothetical protein